MGKAIQVKQFRTIIPKHDRLLHPTVKGATSKTCLTKHGTPKKSLRLIKSQITKWHGHV